MSREMYFLTVECNELVRKQAPDGMHFVDSCAIT